MARVVRPGGRVVCLELTPPPRLVAPFARLWTDHAVPLLGRLVARETDAYRYLPASVHRFPPAAELAAIMRAAGLDRVQYRRLSGGAVALHVGTVRGMSTVAAVLEVPGVSTYLDAVEERLRETVGRSGGEVSAAGVDTLASGGKRLRPMLVHLCAPPPGGRAPASWPPAARWSSFTWRRSSTTTRSTPPRSAAAGRRCGARAARWSRRRLATTCSPGRSRSS